jgi:uncharacterized protein (DUF427 family)
MAAARDCPYLTYLRYNWLFLTAMSHLVLRKRDMTPYITIRKAPGTWTVRAGGAVLGETSNALELSEGDYPAVIYFPREDIAMAFLDESDKTTHCPHKGDARYFSIVTKSKTLADAVWSYEAPKEDVARIKDHLAFYQNEELTVEQL